MLPLKKNTDLIIPDKQDADLAIKSCKTLVPFIQSVKGSIVKVKVMVSNKERTLTVPLAAIQLLADILTEMGSGNAVTLTPIHAELTTQEAADLLNVSRPYLVKLLEENKIPHRKVGTRRKVLAVDILTYKKNIDKKRMKTLDELTKLSQELGLYE